MLFFNLLVSFFFINSGINATTISKYELPDRDQFYYSGKESGQIHTLTMELDSTFHLTVPNNTWSCWTWGEYGGKIAILSDAIEFHFNHLPGVCATEDERVEIFAADDNQNLIRISKKQFMFENYKLKKWKVELSEIGSD